MPLIPYVKQGTCKMELLGVLQLPCQSAHGQASMAHACGTTECYIIGAELRGWLRQNEERLKRNSSYRGIQLSQHGTRMRHTFSPTHSVLEMTISFVPSNQLRLDCTASLNPCISANLL